MYRRLGKKVDYVTKETKNEDMAVIGGIPPWVQMYFEKLINETGKIQLETCFQTLNYLFMEELIMNHTETHSRNL